MAASILSSSCAFQVYPSRSAPQGARVLDAPLLPRMAGAAPEKASGVKNIPIPELTNRALEMWPVRPRKGTFNFV